MDKSIDSIFFFDCSTSLHPRVCLFNSCSMFITYIVDLALSSFIFLLTTYGVNSDDSMMQLSIGFIMQFLPAFSVFLTQVEQSIATNKV